MLVMAMAKQAVGNGIILGMTGAALSAV